MKDYYRILGISGEASAAEIKKAYFGMVRKYPPDRRPKEFMQVREAYEVLSDENTRKQYDSTASMPEVVKVYFDAGRKALEDDEPEEAIKLLERVIKVYPEFSVVNSLLGDAYYKNENSGKAIAIFEKLVKKEPKNAGFAGKLAHAYLKRGWLKKAVSHFRRALSLDEDNISLWMGLIDCYVDECDYEGARTAALEAVAMSEKKGWEGLELYYHLIQCDIYLDDFAALDIHLEAMKKQALEDESETANVAWFLMHIGKLLLRGDDVKNAEAVINAAFELAPEDKEIREVKEKADRESRMLRLIENLREDKSFDGVFADMIEHEMDKCDDPNCFRCVTEQLSMEIYVISECDTLRSQLMRLRRLYPELFQMKRQFFEQALDRRKAEAMYYNCVRKLEKAKRNHPDEFDELGVDLSEFDDEEEEYGSADESYAPQEPAKRDANKVGRNDPCPCGSGKKYKKCCLNAANQ